MKIYMVGNANIRRRDKEGNIVTTQFVQGRFYKATDADAKELSLACIKETSSEYKEYIKRLEDQGKKVSFSDPVVLKEKSSLIPSDSNPVVEDLKEALSGAK